MSASPVAPRPVEVELKYRLLEPAAGDRYLLADDLGGFRPITPVRSTQLEDRYLDTADGALARAGFAARLRQTARGTTVSVKSTARRPSNAPAHRREELEGPADRTAQPRDWPPSDARSLVLELCGDAPLVELVTIRQLRRKRQLESEGALVELSLDEVDAVARSRVVQRFVELEVEVVEGDEIALDPIEQVLSADAALAISTGSKLESALQAIRSTSGRHSRRAATVLPFIESAGRAATSVVHAPPEAPAEPRPTADRAPEPAAAGPAVTAPARDRPRLAAGRLPGVLADDHLAEGARKLLRFDLGRMLAAESAARDGSDADPIRPMHDAARRQEATWRLFGGAFVERQTRGHRAGLRAVVSRLAAVADVDARLDSAESYRGDLPSAERRALEPLLVGWRTDREDAHALLLRDLDSGDHGRWLDDYADFVRRPGLAVRPVSATRPHRIRDTAGSRILAAYESVRAFEPIVRAADAETLERLGAAAMELVDALVLLGEVLGPDAEELAGRVAALHEHVRAVVAAHGTARLARSFLAERAGDLRSLETKAVTRYAERSESDAVTLMRAIGGSWRGVTGSAFRRSLARTIASL